MKHKCKKCKKEIEHPRRGMCLNCYRKETGLSKSKTKQILKIKKINKSKVKKEEKQEITSVKDTWWEKYQKADMLEQQKLLAELPLLKELAKNGFPNLATSERYNNLSPEALAQEQEKFNSHMLVTMLYSYINDLIELKDS